MKYSKSGMSTFAAATLLAAVSLSASSARALITVTSPLTTNSGTNYITIGAYEYWVGFSKRYRLAKCEDGVYSDLRNSSGALVELGTSPNLSDHVDLKIFQNCNDDVRRVPSGGTWCDATHFMQPLQSNGYYIQMWLNGGNDYTPNFNLGGGMQVFGGPGNDTITINTTTAQTVVKGEDGCDTLATYGSGADLLEGGNHDDRLNWGAGAFNYCDGGAGFDYCEATTCGFGGGQMVNCETYVSTYPHQPVCQ
jgi:hypothetical protein